MEPTFPLLDEDLKEQLLQFALQAKQQAAHPSQAEAVSVEVGDIPEEELERVDANVFKPVENSETRQIIQFLALKSGLKVSIAQRKPGFFNGAERLPINWSVVIVIPGSSSSSQHPHNHDHSHGN